ncbi:alginate lyase family protein, partial [candidate division KSB1 bacterium]|nr:alginate lyase family protein [candidate division KSB1 bacterium]
MKRIIFLIFIISVFINYPSHAKERPNLIITKEEANAIKQAMGKYPLLDQSLARMKNTVATTLSGIIEVPPPGEAGGYEHERHKQNYREMHQAGILFSITGEEKYARFVREMLLEYAKLYPTLGKHPLSHNQAPGKLFHQMLNETVWLTYTSMAYDCIYDWLDKADRENIEKNVFRVIVDWFITENHHEFNRIHNHGTWTVCSVGMIGYVLGNQDLVDMALYGTEKDGKGGFLKQLDLLFSPDGYYMEGPYYIRYALRPFFFFAEAIERNQPELKIYEYRNQILKKAYYSAVQTTFPNGVFPPINDASRTMDIQDVGVILANDLVYSRYGADPNLLAVAKIQDEVLVNGSGLKLAQDFNNAKNIPDMDWGSIEFTDGFDGTQGGLGILRMGTGENQSMLLMKYGVHGQGHGHFDKLTFIFYNQGHEIIPDYGFCRWINIEPKFGGRYLPENKSYAMQTIAHNTVTVDQTCQNNFDRKIADEMSGKRHFFDVSNPNIQVMSAHADEYYPGVNMQRTMFLIKDDHLKYPIIVDLYRL